MNPDFDKEKFEQLFKDEKLSAETQLIKYGYISGWLQGLFADKRVYEEYKVSGKKDFQEAYMKILEEDFKNFQKKVKF